MPVKNELTIDIEAVASVRRMLLIGLSAYGEIERLDARWDLVNRAGEHPDEELKPIHPTGCCDTVSQFADALLYLDNLTTTEGE